MCEVLAVAAPAAIAFREVAPWAGEMERLGIAESRRVRGLGANQRAALENEFGGVI